MKNTKRNSWKGVGWMFKTPGFLVVIALLAPIGFFTWRAGQPMSMPEYDGRTYYELLAERRQAYADLATEYQANHPDVEVKEGMCFQLESMVSITNTLPWSAFCAASEFIPFLRVYGPHSRSIGCGQMDGTWLEFPSTWWRTYEKLLYTDILTTRPEGPVPYCRIPAP